MLEDACCSSRLACNRKTGYSFSTLSTWSHKFGSFSLMSTDLDPVEYPLVVSLLLDQPRQLFSQLRRAQLLLVALLCLIAQCELDILVKIDSMIP